jgi:hypothetical protein
VKVVIKRPARDTRLKRAKRPKERSRRPKVQRSFQRKLLTMASSTDGAEATIRGRCAP